MNGGRDARVAVTFTVGIGNAPSGPVLSPRDAGGMPECLIELAAGQVSAGWLLNARTPYAVWAAPKRTGVPYTAAEWKDYGPWTLGDRGRYVFILGPGGRLANNTAPPSTELSPALASLWLSARRR